MNGRFGAGILAPRMTESGRSETFDHHRILGWTRHPSTLQSDCSDWSASAASLEQSSFGETYDLVAPDHEMIEGFAVD